MKRMHLKRRTARRVIRRGKKIRRINMRSRGGIRL